MISSVLLISSNLWYISGRYTAVSEKSVSTGSCLECRIHEASFVGVDLSRADFRGSDLSGARFVETDLTDADLSEASGYDIAPRQNRLRRTKFSREAALQLVADLGVIVP